MSSIKTLFDLLRSLFRGNDDLSIFLRTYPYVNAEDLVSALPSLAVPKASYFMSAVDQIRAHGLDKRPFFDALETKYPGQQELIAAARDAYLRGATAIRDRPEDDPAIPLPATVIAGTPAPSPDQILTQEKIMGERSTFVDVAYLAIGYQRAKSVAMLRMTFPDTVYTGTAFLVAPDTLLTAHHNLWTKGRKASRVDVIFDYERSIGGPDLEVSVVEADLSSFIGSEADDWALMRLPAPQAGRPLAPLGTSAAKKDDRVAIIQHPHGWPKQVALQHNLVTFANAEQLQYLTDTMPGSSGSPVFDAQWNVVGLHRAGGPIEQPGRKERVYRNVGVQIGQVLAGLAAQGVSLPE